MESSEVQAAVYHDHWERKKSKVILLNKNAPKRNVFGFAPHKGAVELPNKQSSKKSLSYRWNLDVKVISFPGALLSRIGTANQAP
jgi:hypothetical protein